MKYQVIKQLTKELLEDLSTDDYKEHFDTTKPKYTVSPDEKLINLIYAAEKIKKKFPGMKAEEIADKLGFAGNKKVIHMVDELLNNKFYQSNY